MLSAGLALGEFTFPLELTITTYDIIGTTQSVNNCSFIVEVVDLEPPMITCPQNIVRQIDFNTCAARVSWTTAKFSHNCVGSTGSVESVGSVVSDIFSQGTTFPLGASTLQYTLTDNAGLQDSCIFDIR